MNGFIKCALCCVVEMKINGTKSSLLNQTVVKKNQEEEIIEIRTKSIKGETIHSLGFGDDFSEGQLFSLFSDSG